MAKQQPGLTLSIQVLALSGLLYEGEAIAVSATNASGPFAILPQHVNFVSIIQGEVFIHENSHQAQHINIEQGVIHCQNNQVKIFAGITSQLGQLSSVSPPPVSTAKP